jgi:hypothetical protein
MCQRMPIESVTEEVFALSDFSSKKALVVLISTFGEPIQRGLAARRVSGRMSAAEAL